MKDDIYSNFFSKPFGAIPITVKKYIVGPKSDSYSLLVNSFFAKVYEKMIDIIITEKNIPEPDAVDFVDNIISSHQNIRQEVEQSYNDGDSKKECAHKLLDKYYKTTKLNFNKTDINHEEVTEVTESIIQYLKPKSTEEIEKHLNKLTPKEKFKKACEYGLVELVDEYLKSDTVSAIGDLFDMSFCSASSNGHINVIKLLLKDKRVDPSFLNNSAIMYASNEGHYDIVELLLKDKRVINTLSKEKQNYYKSIIINNDNNIKENVKSYLKPKSDEDIKKSLDNLTPEEKLFKGCQFGILSVVKKLIDGDFNPSGNEHCFITACSYGHLDIVKELLKDGRIDPSATHSISLSVACRENHIDIVKELLKDKRVNPHDKEVLNIPIEIASLNKNYSIVKLLLNDERVKKNLTKSKLEKYTKQVEGLDESVKDYLKPKSEERINKELENLDPSDILYISMVKGYLPGVKMAVEKGVDLEGFEALEMAALEGRLNIVEYLISVGVNIPKDMSNILQTAFENNNTELMNYLIKIYVKKYKDINILLDYINKNENDYYELFDYLKNVYQPTLKESKKMEDLEKSTASSSLLWNFIVRLKDLNLKFILNTRHIEGIDNSLNTEGFNFYIETKPINNKEVAYEFKHSKILSSILTTFDMYKESSDDISFYIGINKNNFLNFGYVIDKKRFKIGSLKYSSNDIIKISPMIESINKDIDMNILSRKFLSTLSLIQHYNKIFYNYLEAYEDDVQVFTSIVDNKFVVVIESTDSDIINKKYLDSIVTDNIFYRLPFKYKWEIKSIYNGKKLYFYFTIE